MKKAFSFLAVIIFILTAGCEKQSTNNLSPPPAPTSFSANVKAVYGDTEMTALVTQKNTENFTLDFLTPEAIAPLTIEYSNGVCKVTYDGLSFETDFNRFPQAETGALLVNAISDVIQGMNLQTAFADGIWTYTGNGERGVFNLTQNGETGEWLEFTVDGADLKITFSNFKQ